MIRTPGKVLIALLALNIFVAPILATNGGLRVLSSSERNDVRGGVAWCAILKAVWTTFKSCTAVYTGWKIVEECWDDSESGDGGVEQESGLTIIRQQTEDDCGECKTTETYDKVQEFKVYQ